MTEGMSLKKMATMSLQEIFDFAVNHLRTQGVPSVAPDGARQCLYRGPDGTKCAFGAFISDDEYLPHMEGKTVFVLARNSYLPATASDEQLSLLYSLQLAHDETQAVLDVDGDLIPGTYLERLEASLRDVAKKHNLVYAAPEGGN
jgi:hypothetical protein